MSGDERPGVDEQLRADLARFVALNFGEQALEKDILKKATALLMSEGINRMR